MPPTQNPEYPNTPDQEHAIYKRLDADDIVARTLRSITALRRTYDRMLYGLLPEQIKAIRLQTGLSQGAFSKKYSLSPGTVAQWESGRRSPDRAAVSLLKVISHAPDVVNAALAAYPDAATAIRNARPEKEEEPDPYDQGSSQIWPRGRSENW